MIAMLSLLIAFQVSPELKQHVDAGLKAKSAGDLDMAIREFQKVAELAPNLAPAHVNLGAVYLAKRNYSSAIPALRRALELNPDLPGAHGMLGTALLAQGYDVESIPHLERSKSDDLLGVAFLETGQFRKAADHLETALQSRPNDPDLLYYLAQAYGQLSKQAADRLQADAGDSARAQQVLGDVMAASGNREAAEKHFRDALALRSELRGVHYAIGALWLESGDYEKAEKEFKAEVQLTPGSAAAAYKLGFVLLNQGQTLEAIAELKRADKLRPDMPETLLELGKALNANGDAKSAESHLLSVLKHEQEGPIAAAAHFQLSQVYRKLMRNSDADRELALFQKLREKRK